MLLTKIKDYKLILASQSPRRKFLMQQAQFQFTVINPSHEDENYPSDLSALEVAPYLAEKKASSFKNKLLANEILITADTVVILNNQVLNKPANEIEAFQMLQSLSGNTHMVITGVCLLSLSKKHVFSDTSLVTFRDLTDEEIQFYINNYHPFDKAGAYGAQDWIGLIGIEKIVGSYFNVMGLPVGLLYKELEKFIDT